MASLADLKLPDINSDKFDATDSKQIKSYLYQLNEQLRYLLGNIGEDQLSNDVQDQLDLIRQLINALAGNSGTMININTGDRTQGWQPSELEQLTEQIKGIGERLGSGNTTTGESGGGGFLNVESVTALPSNPDPETIYLVQGAVVMS
ncbi:hypothetical protein [uncultured Gemmiger sp.]|uniref:hypothetical protein n=1 Tax=uncultured Gemmiger sp. TaxID=1623490 RepID=UPI002591D7C3|nr:hypothetical protein [uncultured Gemmiger sp.]